MASVKTVIRPGLARFGAVVFALALLLPQLDTARATVAEDEVTRFVAEARRLGRSPRAILPVLEIWKREEEVAPAVLARALAELSGMRTLSPAVRAYAAKLELQVRRHRGDVVGADRALDELGYVHDFRVIGPFDNEGKAGFDRESPPELRRADAVDLTAIYPGKERSVQWRAVPDVMRSGYFTFDALLRPNTNACGLAETSVVFDRAEPVSIWAGASGAIKVYWNGAEVLRDATYRIADPDRSAAIVQARVGANRLLVKVCVSDSLWGFYLRIGRADGSTRGDLRVDSTRTDAPPRAAGVERLPRVPEAPLAAFEAAVLTTPPRAQALEDLARYLELTYADDPAERRARQLAERAAEIEPTAARHVLAASLHQERAEIMRHAAAALAAAPDDPAVKLLSARIERRGPSPERALPILASIPRTAPEFVAATLLRADIERELGLAESARATVEAALAVAPDSPRLRRVFAEAKEALGRRAIAVEERQAVLAVRYDDYASRRMLISDALARGDARAASEHLDALRALQPANSRTLAYLARSQEALRQTDQAFALYRGALELAPEDTELLALYGRALLRADQDDAAVDVFRKILVIEPQHAETRDLLAQIAPEPRADESFQADADVILSRRRGRSDYPVTLLQDLTVNTVFDNGLGSSFRQIAAEVHDVEGARRWRSYSIQFDPEAQRVDIHVARVFRGGERLEAMQTFERQLGEPWYRMYYDTRALIVVFPDLEPGDVVELVYRVDDIAQRNRFADYYGDIHLLQGSDPVVHLEYVLDVPAARAFYFNSPDARDLVREEHEAGGRRTYRFARNDVAPVGTEVNMPGATEVVPYLHVSTYRTWEDVGRWYWGLIRDQLYADEALKRTVATLLRGATDTRTKVQRIYDWVVSHTRYVALEFGIHGFLPYRVPLIVQRGFGDCKDKGSLIYTMLREAGIDAEVVLVRTRRNGDIAELPASLAVFDHFIAYVPELDLYLDGTAEHSGSTELPNMDQGVTVLHVGPNADDIALRRSPVIPPAQNGRTRTLEVEVAADGSATIGLTAEVRGSGAAYYREVYQAEGTRRERLERELSQMFPGVSVLAQRFENLDEREEPVRMTTRFRVPQLGRRSGEELVLPPSMDADLLRTYAPTATRRFPVEVGERRQTIEERVFRAPEGMRVTTLPDSVELTSPFGRFSRQVETQGRETKIRTELVFDRDRILPSDYAAYRAWLEQIDAAMRARVVLRGGAQ